MSKNFLNWRPIDFKVVFSREYLLENESKGLGHGYKLHGLEVSKDFLLERLSKKGFKNLNGDVVIVSKFGCDIATLISVMLKKEYRFKKMINDWVYEGIDNNLVIEYEFNQHIGFGFIHDIDKAFCLSKMRLVFIKKGYRFHLEDAYPIPNEKEKQFIEKKNEEMRAKKAALRREVV